MWNGSFFIELFLFLFYSFSWDDQSSSFLYISSFNIMWNDNTIPSSSSQLAGVNM